MKKLTTIVSTKILSDEVVALAKQHNLELIQHNFIQTKLLPKNQWVNFTTLRTDLIVFTSSNAVRSVLDADLDISQSTVAGISGATKQLLEKNNIEVSICAPNAARLASKIADTNPTHVNFFCGENHLPDLPNLLRSRHLSVDEIIVYRTVPKSIKIDKPYDVVLLFSPSGVKSFLERNTPDTNKVYFCIGETTAQSIPKTATFKKIITSPHPTQKSMIESVVNYYSYALYDKK